jgi:excisionase family DNA binding protein
VTPGERELLGAGFVSVAEAARWLAISRSRMYELVKAGVLSHARISGKIVLPRAALCEYAAAALVRGSVA